MPCLVEDNVISYLWPADSETIYILVKKLVNDFNAPL